jgi:3',5'-cyclic-AMP phosphodiesterase
MHSCSCNMQRVRFIWIAAVACCWVVGCRDSFEFSPNQVFDKDSKIGINETNLAWLHSLPGDDTITIAFVGDSQRFYDELSDFIDTVNAIQSIDFVLLAGDISDFGLLEEFEMISEKMAALKKPYFGIIGNHDVLGKGDEVFERMYGPLNFSFNYRGVKFVAHNTNSKEYNTGKVPDLNWLQSQFIQSDSAKYFVGVSHVPPFSDDFDKNLEKRYAAMLEETPNFLVSLHGHIHQHKDGYPYGDGVRYITSFSFDKRSFVLLKIYSGNVESTIVDY